MPRFWWVLLAAGGLLLGATLLAQRLVRARTRGMSVRLQVFLALACIVGAFAGGLGLLVIDRVSARATWLATETAQDEASVIATVVAGQIERGERSLGDAAIRISSAAVRGPDRAGIGVLDRRGRVLVSRGVNPHEPGSVSVRAPIRVNGRVVGYVRIVKLTVVVQRLLADFAPTVAWISLTLLGAAALAAVVIGRAVADPIERLTSFAERVSEGERRAQPPAAPYGREVKRLTAAIERMKRGLEGRPFVETFAADLGHELKNPVAAIRASAEVLDEGALAEPEEAKRFVSRILQACSRVEAILGDLLSLARIEARGVEQDALVALDEAAGAAVGPEREARVKVTASRVKVRGDSAWLSRAVANMVDNAILHGATDAPVLVSVTEDDETAIVSVTSRGTVAAHVRKRLFQRFVTTRADRGGTGLGLAIVRAVAEAHGGRVELARPGPPEVEVRMVLPRA